MKKRAASPLLIAFLVAASGCFPGGDWGMGGSGAPHPGGPRAGIENDSARLSGPSHLPECYMRGRTLVMVYEKQKRYLEASLDEIQFNLKPRRYNTFSYFDFKEFENLDYEGLTQIRSVYEGVRFLEEEEKFVANRYSKEQINRAAHTIYRYSGGHWDVETSYKWLSFMLTDPMGSDRVIYIRRESY